MFVAAISFSVNVASPFFTVHMLRDLNFSYLLYTLITLSAVLTTLSGVRLWGEHADHVGNVRVMKLTALFIPLIPFLWLFSHHPLYLICIQVMAGFCWGGFNLAASNFIYDAVSPAKRIRCISYFNVLNGTAICAGSLIGGYLASRLPGLMGYRLGGLFLLSGILRLATVVCLAPLFKEVRQAKPVRSVDLFFSVVGVRPILGGPRRPR